MRWIPVGLMMVVFVVGCEQNADPASAAETEADTERVYGPAVYDTVTWASEKAAVDRGRDIYAWSCADCHGDEGRGDGGRVVNGDTLRPLSFHVDGWRFARDPDRLYRSVFAGNSLGMPHWPLRQMRPRDIVAVERYIRLELFGEGAGEGDGAGGT